MIQQRTRQADPTLCQTPNQDHLVPAAWCAKVSGTLINPATLLATDYLNHFNEVVMLLGMVADMPDLLDECRGWKLKSYAQHFRDSGLSYGALAAEAFEHAPLATKAPFETTVDQLEMVIKVTVRRLDAAQNDSDAMRAAAATGVATLNLLIERLGGIIAGAKETLDQNEIDGMLAP